jgi:hypothetical protein
VDTWYTTPPISTVSLNIKNEEAQLLARELAALTG